MVNLIYVNMLLRLYVILHFRYITVSKIVEYIGISRARALPGFYGFLGCDTTSSVVNRGTGTAWSVWNSYPAATCAFLVLSKPVDVEDLTPIMPIIETFINKLFLGISCDLSSVDEARLDGIIFKSRNFSNLPPSSDALFQHVLRTALQVCDNETLEFSF